MDSETHFSIVFNIYGGSNQILPNATSATQNYYGDEAEPDIALKEKYRFGAYGDAMLIL